MQYSVHAQEGLSRQIQGLRAVVESYKALVDGKLSEVETELGNWRTCADKAMLFFPEHLNKDSEGCVAISVSNFSYQSPQTQHSGNGNDVVFTHGLGSAPQTVQVGLINVIAEHGYVPGDTIYNISPSGHTADRWHDSGFTVISDAAAGELRLIVASRGMYVVAKSPHGSWGHMGVSITPDNWAFRVSAK